MRLAIIIPAYNEEGTISGVIKKAKKYGTVIVVNDASKDRTENVAKKSGAYVITHSKNKGLGGALRTGFQYAINKNFDAIITLDADGQHDPEDIPKFLDKLNESYEFVLGERNLSRYPLVKKVGNFFLNNLTNLIAGTNLRDTESGFRAFKASALRKLKLKALRYEIAAEIISEVGINKLKSCNVKVASPCYRQGVGFFDGVKNFIYLLKK